MLSETTSPEPDGSHSAHQRPPALGSRRIVIDSVGTANAGIVGVLRRVVPRPAVDIAKLVYQAPSELVRGISVETATEVARALEEAGLEVRVVEGDAPVESGRGEYEVALRLDDVASIPRVIREVGSLLGIDADAARRLVCATPAVILGSVSDSTVAAMRRRFATLPVTLDVSKTDQAVFYVVVASSSATVLASVYEIARGQVQAQSIHRGHDTVSATELRGSEATRLWESLRRTGATTTVCNLDFERYDIRLDEGTPSEELGALLGEHGIPAGVVGRVLQNLPMVIAQDVSHADALSLVERIARTGGRATATPHTTNRFALVVDRVTNPAPAACVLEQLGGLSPASALGFLTNGSGVAFGSFTKTTARWLRHELRAVGTQVHLEVL